mgnify:FL=1
MLAILRKGMSFIMKIMFASDIHGSYSAAQKIADTYEKEGAHKLVLLGDLLYHGPRNPLSKKYNPQSVAELLNAYKNDILCVRGNCDSEVDQMLIDFPIMSDYALISADGIDMFLTHGHLYNEQHLPPLKNGSALISGHTHVPRAVKKGSYMFLNPGSASLPKENFKKSYMIYENGVFVIKDFKNNIIFSLTV